MIYLGVTMAQYIVKWTPIRNGKEVPGITTTTVEAASEYDAEEQIRQRHGDVAFKSVKTR